MNPMHGRVIAAATLLTGLFFCNAPAQAQGYYINPNMYSNMYAVNAAQLAQNLQFAGRMKQLRETQAILASADAVKKKGDPPVAPLSATDFKPTGRRDAPQRLAAQVEDPALRPQITKLAIDILAAIEGQPDFRKNNLAYALTVFLGGSLQVVSGKEFSDEQTVALAKWINDEMVAAGAVAKLDATQRTQLYDALLLQGGLVIGIAAAGAENHDEEMVKTSKAMARDALAIFGIQ